MKRLAIIPDDNMVVVDGHGIQVTMSVPDDIHAIQWDDEKQEGEIEYRDSSGKGNVKIGPDEIASFLPLVDVYGSEKARMITEEADIIAKRVAHDALDSTKRSNAFTKERNIEDVISEILDYIDEKGDGSGKLKAIIAKSKEIKGRFPKEGE